MDKKARPAGPTTAIQPAPDSLDTPSSRASSAKSAKRFRADYITWLAITTACVWWASSLAFLAGRLPGASDRIPLSDTVGAFGMAIVPGLILIITGLVGSALMRLRNTEKKMLTASDSLLEPVSTTGRQIENVGEAVASHARQMNEVLKTVRANAGAASGDIKASCAALEAAASTTESATTSSVASLKKENERLTAVVATLTQSVQSLTKAISSHHAAITGTLAETSTVVENADAALGQRLVALGNTSATITSKIGELDQIAGHADRATASLNSVLANLDDRIASAAAQMSASTRAGSAMEDAARGAVSVLKENSATAVDQVKSACSELTLHAQSIAEQVSSTLDELKDAQAEAETKAKNVVRTARVESSTAEARIRELGNNLFETAAEATRIAEAGLDTARSRIEKASRLLGGQDDTAQQEMHQIDPPLSDSDKSLRSSGSKTPGPAIISSTRSRPVTEQRRISPVRPAAVASSRGRKSDVNTHADQNTTATNTSTSASWRDILSDIDHDPSSLDDNASELIERFKGAGVGVRRAVTAPDLRRIAEAAQWGEYQRRMAVAKAAPQQVQTVAALLDDNTKLAEIAEDFVSGCETQMLQLLNSPGHGGNDAQVRMIAWLLADAATASAGKTPATQTTQIQTKPKAVHASGEPRQNRKK